MTPFAALTSLAGLSLREAGEFHGTPIDTIKGWSNGRRRSPAGVLSELKSLIAKQANTAENVLAQIDAMPNAPDTIEIGYPSDDYEAKTLGWPCVGAWQAMAARVIAGSAIDIMLVPRGSTPATAAAIDAHERKV